MHIWNELRAWRGHTRKGEILGKLEHCRRALASVKYDFGLHFNRSSLNCLYVIDKSRIANCCFCQHWNSACRNQGWFELLLKKLVTGSWGHIHTSTISSSLMPRAAAARSWIQCRAHYPFLGNLKFKIIPVSRIPICLLEGYLNNVDHPAIHITQEEES
jgi:hypothetical protein